MVDSECDVQEILNSSEVFQQLPKAALKELLVAARIERYEQRTLLVEKGQRPDHFRFILQGSIELISSTLDGRFTALPILSGSWASWLACFNASPLQYEVWAAKSTQCLALPRQLVCSAVSGSPDALLKVIDHIGETVRLLIAWTLGATVHSPEKRMGHLLLILSGAVGPSMKPAKHTAITQEQIGHIGFGSRQRVARLLRELEAKGLIEMRYGAVSVPSCERLSAFVFE